MNEKYLKHKDNIKEYYLKYRDKILIYKKEWAKKNKEKIAINRREYYKNNKIIFKNRDLRHKDKIKKRFHEYYLNDKENILEKHRIYQKENRNRLNEYNRDYRKNKSSLNYKLGVLLRHRINRTLLNKTKSNKSIDLLGCTINEWKIHLQKTAIQNGYLDFDINNYDRKKFHIDHINSCCYWNLKCYYHQKLCFNFENTQILTVKENLTKNSRYQLN